MAQAYGGQQQQQQTLVTNNAEGLSLTTNLPAPTAAAAAQHNINHQHHAQTQAQAQDTEQLQQQMQESDNNNNNNNNNSLQRLHASEMLNAHLQQQAQHPLNSGITNAETLTNGLEQRSNGGTSIMHSSFALNAALNGRISPTASGSSGGGSRSSAHSLPSHSPALHTHNLAVYQQHAQQNGTLDNCGPATTVVTSAAIMGRLTAGCVDTSNGSFNNHDTCGSDTPLTLLQHHHSAAAHHPFTYASALAAPTHSHHQHHHHHPAHHHHLHPAHHHHHHHHRHHHHTHEAHGLLDISSL